MAKPPTLHYREPGEIRTACGKPQDKTRTTNFTVDVTCRACRDTYPFQTQHAEFMEVVDALSYPKEEHPALSNLGHQTKDTK
jgi:hypothetical protein